MNPSCHHKNPLIREGRSQADRNIPERHPENVKLHDLDVDDWLEFAAEFAKLVHYYSADDPETPNGDWKDFFENRDTIREISEHYAEGDLDPYFGLFITFLKLLAFPQKSLNQLPERHLDYYYREVLHLREKPHQPDRVHVLFELAKNARNTLIEEGVLLDAGNDSDGTPLQYKTTSPVVVNPASVDTIRSVFTDGDGALRMAYNPKHPEGEDEDPDDEKPWFAFGNEEWPLAELSFYISSQLLHLKEGKRTITLTLDFDGSPPDTLSKNNIKVTITGEEEWLQGKLQSAVVYSENNRIIIVTELPADEESVAGYDDDIHEIGLAAESPVMKILFTDEAFYLPIKKLQLQNVKITVEADEIRSLRLQNEMGEPNPAKPFMPFGSAPKIGSKLKILCDEFKNKPIKEFGLNMKWLNLPVNFTNHYVHYQDEIDNKRDQFAGITGQVYNVASQIKMMLASKAVMTEVSEIEEKGRKAKITSEGGSGIKKEETEVQSAGLMAVQAAEDDDPLKKEFRIRLKTELNDGEDFALFSEQEPLVKVSHQPVVYENPEIELILLESFYHELYNKVYVAKTLIASKKDEDDISPDLLPNPPYTPLLDELTLSYKAEASLNTASSGYSSEHATVSLFRQHPFGTEKISDVEPSIFPDYSMRTLFIGLKEMEPGSNVTLLFQVDEGSENPENSFFTENDVPEWSVLTDNGWRSLKGRDIVRNQTNNFLRSGIVELQIPRDASKNHTEFPDELTWLRIRMQKPADAVPQFIDIHAQVTEAIFEDNNNSKDHLEKHVPEGTIGQLVYRRSAIKSAEQPYSSFGGAPAESPESFYKRVSERLRHKHRAVSIWDYEHLVLEEFPEIYKVKCLNHTRKKGQIVKGLSPGDVTLVLIPKLQSGIQRLKYYPKASQDLMDSVEDFLQDKISPHVNIYITNPDFEEVWFEFGVKFRHGLDVNHHKMQTNEDLNKLLTPWMFDRDADIRFGDSFYKYEIIHFLENLGYIDYIEDFKMYHKPAAGSEIKTEQVQPGSPMAILVSGEHTIKNIEGC
jgi:hypothetical protein